VENIVIADNVRPAGKPGECFYCYEKLGEPHKNGCVTIQKSVEVAITITGIIEVPVTWDANMIEFHMNRPNNCINNQLDYIEGNAMCFCGRAVGKYLRDVSIN